MELPSRNVADKQGRALDGDAIGSPGGNFLLEQPILMDLPTEAAPLPRKQ